jgi:hypothetical protein
MAISINRKRRNQYWRKQRKLAESLAKASWLIKAKTGAQRRKENRKKPVAKSGEKKRKKMKAKIINVMKCRNILMIVINEM